MSKSVYKLQKLKHIFIVAYFTTTVILILTKNLFLVQILIIKDSSIYFVHDI